MRTLPAPRITSSRPFSHCGVDYAGPVILRKGKQRNVRNHKAYICIFVCFVTKTIHRSSERFNNRLIFGLLKAIYQSRRGMPNSMYSDNGITFVGASRQLSEFYNDFLNKKKTQQTINQFLCNLKITW